MKEFVIFSILLFSTTLFSQSLQGSWKLIEENGQKVSDKEVIRIYQDNYFAEGAKETGSNEFLWALGGEFTTDDYSVSLDFNTRASELVDQSQNPKLSFINEDRIKINKVKEVQVWERISSDENDLSGNWVITGRKRNGEMNKMTPGDRRTIKILGGNRFQWVAFNSATREFFGTGGGNLFSRKWEIHRKY